MEKVDLIQFLEQLRLSAAKANVEGTGAFVRNMERAIQEVTDYRQMVEYLQRTVQELCQHIMVREPQTQWPQFILDSVVAGCTQSDPKESGQSEQS